MTNCRLDFHQRVNEFKDLNLLTDGERNKGQIKKFCQVFMQHPYIIVPLGNIPKIIIKNH